MSRSWDSWRNPGSTTKQSAVGTEPPIRREQGPGTQHNARGEGMPAAAAAKGTGLLGQ